MAFRSLRRAASVTLKSLLKEPLLHFLVIGALLFAGYALLGGASRTDKPRIVVSGAHMDQLAAAFAKAWRRPPTDDELKGLLDDWLTEEIVVREATAAGLDRGDAVIRRRLRQKFDMMAEEQGVGGIPTDAELEGYMATHGDRFATPALVSFQQIVLAVRTVADAKHAAALARPLLEAGVDPGRLAQPTMLPGRVEASRIDAVTRDFGKEFTDVVAGVPLNVWNGPVRSSFGWHLVRVTAHTPGAVPALASIRAIVTREWENERRTTARNDLYRRLRDRYEIVVEAKPVTAVASR
jgi:hypothetical protein